MKIGLRKVIFFWCQGIVFMIYDCKMGVKMNLRIVTKNYAADPEIGFLKNRFQSLIAAQRPCRQRRTKIQETRYLRN